MRITVELDSSKAGGTPGPGASGTEGKDAADAAREVAVLRTRLRRSLIALTALCLLLGAAGFAFARWMMTLPPGTLKAP